MLFNESLPWLVNAVGVVDELIDGQVVSRVLFLCFGYVIDHFVDLICQDGDEGIIGGGIQCILDGVFFV